jgi:hypothetical protein
MATTKRNVDEKMKDYLTAYEAAVLDSRSGRTRRAYLRKIRDNGTLDKTGAWQNPPQKNGIWTIRKTYLEAIANENNWPFDSR